MNPSSDKRIFSLDLLRGLVMIIMALDHTRDFFHFDSFIHDPMDVKTTSPLLYFTRWITHYCAPVFVFLAGTSIFLQGRRKSLSELSVFLIKRGIWLILVEMIIVSFSWTFDIYFQAIILQVIWAIGISMLLMGFIIRLPFTVVMALGILIVSGHNLLDYIPATKSGFIWDLLHNGNFATHPFGGGHSLVIIYPFLPWLGIMMLGYVFGKIYNPEFAPIRKKWLIRFGLGLIILFVLLRVINEYGNPRPWQEQSTVLYSILSFLDVNKYPPSLMYTCMTIGPALLFLAFFEETNNRLSKVISIYGRVPFFYYILHFYLLHALCMVLFVARGHSFFEVTPDVYGIPFRFMIVGEGYSLTVVYVIWIAVVVALFPICKWFNTYKKNHSNWWLSYL